MPAESRVAFFQALRKCIGSETATPLGDTEQGRQRVMQGDWNRQTKKGMQTWGRDKGKSKKKKRNLIKSIQTEKIIEMKSFTNPCLSKCYFIGKCLKLEYILFS